MKRIIGLMFVWVFVANDIFASDIKISKETVKQGGFFEILIYNVIPKDFFVVTFQGRKYRSAPGLSTRLHRVVVPVHVFDPLGEAVILLERKNELAVPKKIIVEKEDFEESEKIEVIRPLTSKELKQYEQEQKILEKIYSKTTKYPFLANIEEPLSVYPLDKKAEISSPFGFIRKRKVGADSEKIEMVSHGGVDLVVRKGEGVFAADTGIVRLAKELINSGNTVIIDHGYNVFSVYMHLSKVFVSEGEVVWRNDEIALTGDTGRVTGPHLHFGMKVWNTWIDPKYFLQSIGGNK